MRPARISLPLALAMACGVARPPATPPALTLSADTVQLTAAVGAGEVSATIQVSGLDGAAIRAPKVAVVHTGQEGWLAVDVSPRGTSYLVTLRASPAGLSAGEYAATLRVSSSGTSGGPIGVPVALTVRALPPSPVLALSRAEAAFTSNLGDPDPPVQHIQISNAGSGVLAPPAAGVQLGAGPGWLQATVSGGPETYSLSLRAITAGLPSGLYSAALVVTSEGATASPATVPVSLRITSGLVVLRLSSDALAFSSYLGIAPPAQNVSLSSPGDAPLGAVQLSVAYGAGGAGWLTTALGGAAGLPTLSVRPTPFALLPGVYAATVTVEAPGAAGSPAELAVSVQVEASTGTDCPPDSTLRYQGGGNGSTEPADFGSSFFTGYCTGCHASALVGAARQGAPLDLNFDTAGGIRPHLFWIDNAAAKGPRLSNTIMPTSLAPAFPAEADRERLGQWIACGAP